MIAGSSVNAKVSQIHAEVRMRFGSYAGGDHFQTLHLKKWSRMEKKGPDARFLKSVLLVLLKVLLACSKNAAFICEMLQKMQNVSTTDKNVVSVYIANN